MTTDEAIEIIRYDGRIEQLQRQMDALADKRYFRDKYRRQLEREIQRLMQEKIDYYRKRLDC